MTTDDRTGTEALPDPELDQIRDLTGVVEKLVSVMTAGNIGALKLEYGSLRLSLQAKDRVAKSSPSTGDGAVSQSVAPFVEMAEPPSTSHVVAAPMIGTFYVAPAPNEAPFVTPGDTIVEGQTIGIIEAMKIMNEIASDREGIVVEVIAGDGQTVEYGSPLVRIEPLST